MRPCYQQDGDTCGYWCTRIAAEILMQRKFKGDELKRFKDYKSTCSLQGVTLLDSTNKFKAYFPEIPINFDALDVDRPASKDITKLLKPDTVVLLNLQNMDFKATKIVENQKNKYGHNVCCYGYDNENLFIQDSNKSGGKCKKTLSRVLVDKGAQLFQGADLDMIMKLNKKVFHVTEVMVVYLGKPRPKVAVVRRSRRRLLL